MNPLALTSGVLVNILQGCECPLAEGGRPQGDGLHNGLLSMHWRLFTYLNRFLGFVLFYFFSKAMISESAYARLASTQEVQRSGTVERHFL